jgi:hypothetical protein
MIEKRAENSDGIGFGEYGPRREVILERDMSETEKVGDAFLQKSGSLLENPDQGFRFLSRAISFQIQFVS